MGRKSTVPTGDAFLPGTTVEELRLMARREADGKSSRKCLAAMHRKRGLSAKEIAVIIGESDNVTRGWLTAIHQGGISAIPRKKSPGRPRKMPLETRQEIAVAVHRGPQAVGYDANYWTLKLLHRYATEELGLDMSYPAAVKNFGEMGIRIKVPRPEHPLAASPEERALFQRQTNRDLEASAREGFQSVLADEGKLQGYKNGHAQAGFRGVQPTRRLSSGRASATVFVGVGANFLFAKAAPVANTETYIEFRGRLCSLAGKVHVIDDGAGYHESNKSKRDAAENAGTLRRTRTLPHTPNDNPAEPQIRRIKDALSNVALDSEGAILAELKWAMKTGQIAPVPLYKYARVDAPRISPRKARAIEKKLKDGEYFVYAPDATPVTKGRVKLPTADELKKETEILSPEERKKIPPILANSGIPDKFLANLPDALLYESPGKARAARHVEYHGNAPAKRARAKLPASTARRGRAGGLNARSL